MKWNVFIVAILIVASSAVSAFSQANETPITNPNYDAALAKKLGGGDGGMRSYVVAILKTGPNDTAVKGEARTKVFQGHMANIVRLAGEGKMAIAGPFGKNDKTFRGLFIFPVATIEEAKVLAETDPAVRAGVFVVDYIPWYGSASLMATPEIHKKISKSLN